MVNKGLAWLFNMADVYQRSFVLILISATLVSGYCPPKGIHSVGPCAFRIYCTGTIRDVNLTSRCMGSTNEPVSVDLTLSDAIERFDNNVIDKEFLVSVTSFKVSAKWPKTTLSILEYMPRLKNLRLNDNQINNIEGSPFFYLNRLEYLDLSRNSLTDIEELFLFESQPSKLKVLLMARNAIDVIPGDAFSDLKSLTVLDLSHNFISDLNEEPFSNLTNLEVLKLNNNKIKDLNGAVNNLSNLKHLYLRGNQIQNIDGPSLSIIYHLETFDVSGNQLEILKPIMFLRHWRHFGRICKIILSENQITFVPNATSKEISQRFVRHLSENKVDVYTKFGFSKNAIANSVRDLSKNRVDVLTELDLSKNTITNIEFNAFQSIVKLISLDLSSNKLMDFIINAEDLRYIKFLNLSTNFIMNLYFESFSTMHNLQNLDLSYNRLENIADETFTNNYNLKYVNLTNNEIVELKNLHIKMFQSSGGKLDLSNNSLSRLHIAIGEGIKLTVLILHSNQIKDAALIDVLHQNELKTLEMDRNHIHKLNDSSLLLPSNLISLDLGYNGLEEVGPSTFHRVCHLKHLCLRHNRLTTLEYGMFQGLSALSNLDLSFNHIEYLDSKVLMDLKSLSLLSLGHNGLKNLDSKAWLGHNVDLRVSLEGNSFTCDWLSSVLKDFNNGYSRMRPTVHQSRVTPAKNSIEGIPCELFGEKENSEKEKDTDERLLITNQRILEAVREQTVYLRTFVNLLRK